MRQSFSSFYTRPERCTMRAGRRTRLLGPCAILMEMPVEHGERVAVFGLGYVGCVTAACLADLGHSIVGVDRDEHKVRNVLDGRAPFFEPYLELLIQKKDRKSTRLNSSHRH